MTQTPAPAPVPKPVAAPFAPAPAPAAGDQSPPAPPPESPEVAPSEARAPASTEPFIGQIPCYWTLVPLEGDIISASNSVTGESFEGTVAEFNVRLTA